MIKNTFRDKLNEGLPTVGTHFMLTDPDVVELIGGVGYFDYGELRLSIRRLICLISII